MLDWPKYYNYVQKIKLLLISSKYYRNAFQGHKNDFLSEFVFLEIVVEFLELHYVGKHILQHMLSILKHKNEIRNENISVST